jgi:hypothetical protein
MRDPHVNLRRSAQNWTPEHKSGSFLFAPWFANSHPFFLRLLNRNVILQAECVQNQKKKQTMP